MKIRTGFVSNSSSSSFVAFMGIVEDEEKFKEFETKNNVKYERFTYEQVCKEIKHCGDFYDYLSKPNKEYENSTFVFVAENGHPEEPEDGEYDDLEIDFDEFSDELNCILGVQISDGVKEIETCEYTGRNG